VDAALMQALHVTDQNHMTDGDSSDVSGAELPSRAFLYIAHSRLRPSIDSRLPSTLIVRSPGTRL
jgi:hypothetical protein